MIPSPASFGRRRLAAAALAAPVLLAAGCANTPQASYTHPPYGTTLVYGVASTGSYGSGTSTTTIRVAEGTYEGAKVTRMAGAGGTVVQDPDTGAVIAVLDPGDRPLMRYSPALGVQWPIQPGKTWTQEHRLTVGPSTQLKLTSSWKVEGIEDVTVPAGTFRAWRMTFTDNFGFRQTSWTVPQGLGTFVRRETVRPAGHPQGEGTQVLELLQAPAAR